jgi:LPS O-antigen subunit length determinant protein (WzzB/FepE family)
MNYISLMIYHKKFLLVFISVSVLISIIYSFIAPEKYIANAKLQPPEESASFSQFPGLFNLLEGFLLYKEVRFQRQN